MPSLDKAPMTFEPIDGVAFFERRGWTVGAIHSILKHAQRWKRLPTVLRPVAYLPEPNPRKLSHAHGLESCVLSASNLNYVVLKFAHQAPLHV